MLMTLPVILSLAKLYKVKTVMAVCCGHPLELFIRYNYSCAETGDRYFWPLGLEGSRSKRVNGSMKPRRWLPVEISCAEKARDKARIKDAETFGRGSEILRGYHWLSGPRYAALGILKS
jgi:hypothetical protein